MEINLDFEEEPQILPILDRIESGFPRTISVDRGWYFIIKELDEALADLDPEYRVYQVSREFGTLRYFCSLGDHRLARDLIREAQQVATRTCEKCGWPGMKLSTGQSVLCRFCLSLLRKQGLL